MFKKIITYFIILAVVLPIFATILPFGGGVKTAYAGEPDRKKQIVSPCGWTAGIYSGSFPECVMFTTTYLLYELGVNGAVWITGLASDLFNVSIQFSLIGDSFDANKNIIIRDGWAMVRDLFNLVFIFILLYAAISTVLQYGSMDIKKILPGLIVAALLVNFSLMISKVVIDASHVFSWEFYNQIDATKGGLFKTIKGSAEIAGDFEKKDLAGVFLAGFNPQRLLAGTLISKNGVVINDSNSEQLDSEVSAESVSVWKSLQSAAAIKGESFIDTLWRLIIILVFEIGLAVFASFILFAGAIMFIIRVVILWIIMIFSPLAFLGMVLPGMGKYSQMWWKNLIDQAFFAPAFLFMFMLATKFVNADLIDSLLHITPNDTSSIVTGLKMGVILPVVFNFVIVGSLLLMCLIIAKQMGGKSAELGMSLAHKGKNLALGGANKMLWKPLSRNTVGRGFDMMAKSDSIQKIASRFPILGGGIYKAMKKGAGVGGYDQVMEDKIKLGKGLKDAKLRAQYFNNIDARSQKEWYSKASARERVELHELSKNKKLDEYFKALSTEEQEKTIKAKTEVALKKENIDLARTFVDAISSGDINLQKEIMDQIKDTRKPGFIKELESVIPQAQRELLTAATSGKEGSIANSILEVNPLWAATAPAGSPPGTSSRRADFLSGFSGKPGKARNLTSSARQDRDVIRSFTPQHLEDLIKNGNLSDVEAEAIQNEVLTAPSNDPWSAKMVKYMSTGPSKDFWSTI